MTKQLSHRQQDKKHKRAELRRDVVIVALLTLFAFGLLLTSGALSL